MTQETIKDIVIPILVILLGSSVLNFVQFMIQRHDKKKEAEKENPYTTLSKEIDALKKDVKTLRRESDLGDCRSQMLILTEHQPKDTFQILQIAKHYFVDLEGDWYMSTLFKNYCKANEVPIPGWFKDDEVIK